ncbi:MAG: DUF3718 domain-containing protein [Colwellia sp.]|nr:DUF3718 domain-containing protein [Colwellia sp.]
MKNTLLIASILAASFTVVPTIHAEDNLSLRVCEYVSANDKKRLRKFLKKRKLKIRSIFNKIQCNAQNLLEFAASSQALDVGEMIIGKLPVKIVTANIDAVTKHSAHLAVVANKRIK